MSTLRHLIKCRISDKYRGKLNGGRQLSPATSLKFKANSQAAWKISNQLFSPLFSASTHQDVLRKHSIKVVPKTYKNEVWSNLEKTDYSDK